MTNQTTITIPPTQDRDHYRAMTTRELLTAYKELIPSRTNWQELAIALAERLKHEVYERDFQCANCDHYID